MPKALFGPGSLLGGHFVNQQIITVYIIRCSHRCRFTDSARSFAVGQTEVENEKWFFLKQINNFLGIRNLSRTLIQLRTVIFGSSVFCLLHDLEIYATPSQPSISLLESLMLCAEIKMNRLYETLSCFVFFQSGLKPAFRF